MKNSLDYSSYINDLAAISNANNHILPEMYQQHNVFRGLRDISGNGVITGLTEISNIKAKGHDEYGNEVPCEGQLFYRGINIRDFVKGFMNDNRFGFEEAVYLLLFSNLPNESQLEAFTKLLSDLRTLPPSFVRDMIMKAPGKDLMNILSRCVLALYTYDENPDDITIANTLRQCLFLI